jgi:ribosomal protein S18 acetylase RimI-like enzyme
MPYNSCSAVSAPTTEQLVIKRSLRKWLGWDVADWATEQLVHGFDTPHLRQLAGVSGSEGQSELEELFDRASRELGLRAPSPETAIGLYAQSLARDYVAGAVTQQKFLDELCQLCIDTDYRRDLYPFYLLRFAREDLQDSETSFHRLDVTRENFDTILRQEVDTLLGAARSDSSPSR